MWLIPAISGGHLRGLSPLVGAIVSIDAEHRQHLIFSSFFAVLTFCLLGVGSLAAFAQAVHGSIFGTITDQTGAVLPNVHLVLTSSERGTSVETLSKTTGNYEMSHLLPGEYSLKADAHGFTVSKVTNIPIHV